MNLDHQPSAASTYVRTLVSRGCPEPLAQAAAEVLAKEGQPTPAEQALVERAWAAVAN